MRLVPSYWHAPRGRYLTLSREDVFTQRFHKRILYTSLVRYRPIFPGPSRLQLTECNSEPTVFENYVHDMVVDDQLVEMSLWDTAG
jgi:GTPase SAR1 family protein